MTINKYADNKPLNMPDNQQGVALIAVLLVLLLITLIGTVAVRQSNTDLKLSTSAQVEKVLFQANDAAFMKVEREDRILGARKGGAETLKGYMSGSRRDGHEVSFCVRPRSERLFSVLEMSERNENGDLFRASGNGYCNPSDSSDYVNEGRVITQMTFVKPLATANDKVFSKEVVGTASNDFIKSEGNGAEAIQCSTFTGYATSVLPAFSNAPLGDANSTDRDTDTIAGCLKQTRTGTVTVDSCLTALDVPFRTHEQLYRNQPVGVKCITNN